LNISEKRTPSPVACERNTSTAASPRPKNSLQRGTLTTNTLRVALKRFKRHAFGAVQIEKLRHGEPKTAEGERSVQRGFAHHDSK
jgi:hypothetical protein